MKSKDCLAFFLASNLLVVNLSLNSNRILLFLLLPVLKNEEKQFHFEVGRKERADLRTGMSDQ